jgi:hypothetical protein
MTVDPMLIFYAFFLWLLVQVPFGIAIGWWLRGATTGGQHAQ